MEGRWPLAFPNERNLTNGDERRGVCWATEGADGEVETNVGWGWGCWAGEGKMKGPRGGTTGLGR